jgi:hypothetical protein
LIASCGQVLDRTPQDGVVLIRRAEAFRQLGQFEPAYADLARIETVEDEMISTISRKARKMKADMRVVEKQSLDELRGPMVKGLKSNIFSFNRPKYPIIEDSDRLASKNNPFLNRLRHQRLKNTSKKNIEEANMETRESAAVDEGSIVHPKQRPIPLLDLKVVGDIQRKQLLLFTSPSVKVSLEKMQFEADLEQDRFLHRLKPFKVQPIFLEVLLLGST